MFFEPPHVLLPTSLPNIAMLLFFRSSILTLMVSASVSARYNLDIRTSGSACGTIDSPLVVNGVNCGHVGMLPFFFSFGLLFPLTETSKYPSYLHV